MNSFKNFVLILMALIRGANGSAEQISSGIELSMGKVSVDDVSVKHVGADQVSQLVAHLVQQHYSGCHLVFLTTAPYSPGFYAIRKHFYKNEATVVSSDSVDNERLQRALAGEFTATCQVLVLHFSDSNDNQTGIALRLLDRAGLWKLPEMRVLVVGRRGWVKATLLHRSLRNTLHGIYLALDHRPDASSSLGKDTPRRLLFAGPSKELISRRVSVFRRCVFCSGGKTGVHFMYHLNLDFLQGENNLGHITRSSSLSEPLTNLRGHNLRVTTLPYFPYVAYLRERQERGTTVALRDSLNARILHTFAVALNFTYEVRETVDRSFGNINTKGQFSGMVGDLQREEADFCLLLAPTPRRLEVIGYLRLEPVDSMVIVSSKPTLLPAVMSFIRPFSGELWAGLLVGLIVWGVSAWGLQQLWVVLAGGGAALSVPTTLLYGWGALLNTPQADPSTSFSGQMVVGWWLVFCLVISTGYRSSLIAHLTVKGKSSVPEGFNDLVAFDNWKWGIEGWMLDGELLDYFERNTDPVVQTVYRKVEVFSLNELLRKVLDGRFSLVSVKDYIMVVIASNYSDAYGQTPFYVGREERGVVVCFGWGVSAMMMMQRRIRRFLISAVRARIVRLWLAGCSARDISLRTRTSVSTVYRWLRRWQKAYAEKKDLTEEAEVAHGFPDLWAHVNLQLQMYALNDAHGQYLDSHHMLQSILMDSVHSNVPVIAYGLYENDCDA